MSYSIPRRAFGQVPQAVAYTCTDGSIIGLPPGVDGPAQCAKNAQNPTVPTDIATMPQPTIADTMNAIAASVAAQTAQQPPPPPPPVPMQVMMPPPPPAPDTTTPWIIPVVALGALGWFLFAAK